MDGGRIKGLRLLSERKEKDLSEDEYLRINTAGWDGIVDSIVISLVTIGRRRPSMLRFTLLWTKFHLYPVRIRYVFLSKMILILRILVR